VTGTWNWRRRPDYFRSLQAAAADRHRGAGGAVITQTGVATPSSTPASSSTGYNHRSTRSATPSPGHLTGLRPPPATWGLKELAQRHRGQPDGTATIS
jgi:hypothetical protein